MVWRYLAIRINSHTQRRTHCVGRDMAQPATGGTVTHFFSFRFRHFSLLNSVLSSNCSCLFNCACMISSALAPRSLISAISSCVNNACRTASESSINSFVSVMSSAASQLVCHRPFTLSIARLKYDETEEKLTYDGVANSLSFKRPNSVSPTGMTLECP